MGELDLRGPERESGADAARDRTAERAAGSPGDRLADLAGPLAAFHVAVLVAVAVLGLYLTGSLGRALAGLDPLLGIAAYLILWAITRATVGRWLAGVDATADSGVDVEEAGDPGSAPVGVTGVDPLSFVVRAAGWGAVTGVAVLVVALSAFLAARIALDGVRAFTPTLVVLFLTVGYGIGGAIAAAVGGAVGTVLGSLDYALLALATRIVEASGRELPDG